MRNLRAWVTRDERHGERARIEALRRRSQRRFQRTPHVIVERHVDLEVDALFTAFDGVQQPVARLRIVEFNLDAIAADQPAIGGDVEP